MKAVEGLKINGKTASLRRADKVAGSNEPDTAKLARCIAAYAPHDGTFELRIPGLYASRFSRTNSGGMGQSRLTPTAGPRPVAACRG